MAPVGLDLDVRALRAELDLTNDAFRVFAARVVGREHDSVREARSDVAHERTLGAVPLAATAEDDPELRLRERPRRVEELAESVVGVRIVHDDVEGHARHLHLLEAPGGSRNPLERLEDRGGLEAERPSAPKAARRFATL